MEEVTNGIVQRLTSISGTVPVHAEPDSFTIEGPALLVLLTKGSLKKEMDRRYKRSCYYGIRYLPDQLSPHRRADCHAMAERLYEQLRMIDAGNDRVRSTEMTHEILEGVLHFTVSYEVQLMQKQDAVPAMQRMMQEEHVR